MSVLDLKLCTMKLKDGKTPTPNGVEIKIGEGNLSYTEKKKRDYLLDKGKLSDVRNGDEAPLEVKFDFQWEFMRSTSSAVAVPTIEEALKNIGAAAEWISSDSDACRPYAVDIELVYEPHCGTKETFVFPEFRYDSLDHDLRGGKVAVVGQCNVVEPIITRG